jgi:hypothetical protein
MALELVSSVVLGKCESICLVNIVTPVTPQTETPLHVVLVIDQSGSMDGLPIEMANRTIVSICRQLSIQRNNMDFVTVIGFNGQAHIYAKHLPPAEVDVAIVAQGGTNFLAACEAACDVVHNSSAVVIILTDGRCQQVSASRFAASIPVACSVGIIGLGPRVDSMKLTQVALEIGPGGMYREAKDHCEIARVIGDIVGTCIAIAWENVVVNAVSIDSPISDPTNRANIISSHHLRWELGHMAACIEDSLMIQTENTTKLEVKLSGTYEEKAFEHNAVCIMKQPGKEKCRNAIDGKSKYILRPSDVSIFVEMVKAHTVTPDVAETILGILPLTRARTQELMTYSSVPLPSLLARQFSESVSQDVLESLHN